MSERNRKVPQAAIDDLAREELSDSAIHVDKVRVELSFGDETLNIQLRRRSWRTVLVAVVAVAAATLAELGSSELIHRVRSPTSFSKFIPIFIGGAVALVLLITGLQLAILLRTRRMREEQTGLRRIRSEVQQAYRFALTESRINPRWEGAKL